MAASGQLKERAVMHGRSSIVARLRDFTKRHVDLAGARCSRRAARTGLSELSVVKLFDASTGILGLNALRVLQDPAWTARLTRSLATVE